MDIWLKLKWSTIFPLQYHWWKYQKNPNTSYICVFGPSITYSAVGAALTFTESARRTPAKRGGRANMLHATLTSCLLKEKRQKTTAAAVHCEGTASGSGKMTLSKALIKLLHCVPAWSVRRTSRHLSSAGRTEIQGGRLGRSSDTVHNTIASKTVRKKKFTGRILQLVVLLRKRQIGNWLTFSKQYPCDHGILLRIVIRDQALNWFVFIWLFPFVHPYNYPSERKRVSNGFLRWFVLGIIPFNIYMFLDNIIRKHNINFHYSKSSVTII